MQSLQEALNDHNAVAIELLGKASPIATWIQSLLPGFAHFRANGRGPLVDKLESICKNALRELTDLGSQQLAKRKAAKARKEAESNFVDFTKMTPTEQFRELLPLYEEYLKAA